MQRRQEASKAAKQLGSEAAKFLDAKRRRCIDAKSVTEADAINRHCETERLV